MHNTTKGQYSSHACSTKPTPPPPPTLTPPVGALVAASRFCWRAACTGCAFPSSCYREMKNNLEKMLLDSQKSQADLAVSSLYMACMHAYIHTYNLPTYIT